MSAFKVDKVISTLPVTLTPDTVYAVRVGVGFDLYITDNTGAIAHKINSAGDTYTEWPEYAVNAEFNNITTANAGGDVLEYTYKGVVVYRYISSTTNPNGYPTEDSFYSSFDGTNLTGLINTRNV